MHQLSVGDGRQRLRQHQLHLVCTRTGQSHQSEHGLAPSVGVPVLIVSVVLSLMFPFCSTK